MKTIIAAILLAACATPVFAECEPSYTIQQAAKNSEVAAKSLNNRYNLFMTYDTKKDKIRVVSQDVQTCRIDIKYMTSERVWNTFQISYEEFLEGAQGEGE